jgi:hypothetical protein
MLELDLLFQLSIIIQASHAIDRGFTQIGG